MPRLMSVSLTADQVRNRTKTVTRRDGWLFLKIGDRLTLCEKVQGRKKGEPLVRICDVEVTGVSREPIGFGNRPDECAKEGFPEMTPYQFQQFFLKHVKLTDYPWVTRIEWRYL